MPDTPSNDDQFADLFRKLPSARSAEEPSARSAEEPSARGGADRAPLSRRAAREAAAAAGAAPAASEAATGATTAGTGTAGTAEPAPGTAGTAEPVAAAPVPAPRQAASAPSGDAPRAVWAQPAASGGSGTLDSLFGEEMHGDDRARQRQRDADKRKSRIAKWVVLGVVLAIIGGIAGAGFYVWNTYEEQIREVMGWQEPRDYADGEATGEVTVTIADGDVPSTISQTLYDAGVTKTATAFYKYLVEEGLNPTFYPGAYALQEKMTSAAALEALENPENKLENTAQLREGLTVDQSLPLLADGTGIALEDFQAAVADPAQYGVAAQSLEGWLFPATYTFDPGATAQDVIRTLVDRTTSSLDTAGVPAEDRQRILTIASIIQREARFEDDFFKVSRVIQNRLSPDNTETYGKLQMDSTAQYGYGEMHDGTVSSSAEALEDDNPWNTYVHEGLPVGPIANPGDVAIDAAMHPADGSWLYFVTVDLDTGETVFTDTYADHEKAVAQWQQWCADNPDSGC